MGFALGNPMQRTVRALMVILALMSPVRGAMAEEFNKIIDEGRRKDLQKKYLILEAKTDKLVTHKKGIDHKKVKESIKQLQRYIRAIEIIKRQIEDKKELVVLEKYTSALNSLLKVFTTIYQFEVNEDYLRKNIKNPNVFINAKGYLKDLLTRLKEIEKIGKSSILNETIKDAMKNIKAGLLTELKHDFNIIQRMIYVVGTDAQIKQWEVFIEILFKEYPEFMSAKPPLKKAIVFSKPTKTI